MNRERGASLIEVLGLLAIIAVALGAVAMKMQTLGSPLDTSTSLLEGVFREARLNAIATMSAYRVSPSSTTRLKGEKAATCSATTWTVDNSMRTDLATGVTQSPTTWSVCFNSRGISTANVIVTLTHPKYGSRSVEVLVGGTSRVLP